MSLSFKGSVMKNHRILFSTTALALTLLVCSSAFAGTTSYKYDAHGRLIEIDYPNGAVVTYTYDAAGNRTQSTKTP